MNRLLLLTMLCSPVACVPLAPGAGQSETSSNYWVGSRQFRITGFEASVAATKTDGRDWDALGDPPDPHITLLVDGTLAATCSEKNTTAPTCSTSLLGKIVDLRVNSRIEIRVVDRDAMEDDAIGAGVSLAGPQTLHFQTNGQLTSASLILEQL